MICYYDITAIEECKTSFGQIFQKISADGTFEIDGDGDGEIGIGFFACNHTFFIWKDLENDIPELLVGDRIKALSTKI